MKKKQFYRSDNGNSTHLIPENCHLQELFPSLYVNVEIGMFLSTAVLSPEDSVGTCSKGTL
jgi:hypothetical protein